MLDYDATQCRVELALGCLGLQGHLGDALDLVAIEAAGRLQLGAQVEHDVGVADIGEFRRLVVLAERRENRVGLVDEIDDVSGVQPGAQPSQRAVV